LSIGEGFEWTDFILIPNGMPANRSGEHNLIHVNYEIRVSGMKDFAELLNCSCTMIESFIMLCKSMEVIKSNLRVELIK
jgi:hypothetical protein